MGGGGEGVVHMAESAAERPSTELGEASPSIGAGGEELLRIGEELGGNNLWAAARDISPA